MLLAHGSTQASQGRQSRPVTKPRGHCSDPGHTVSLSAAPGAVACFWLPALLPGLLAWPVVVYLAAKGWHSSSPLLPFALLVIPSTATETRQLGHFGPPRDIQQCLETCGYHNWRRMLVTSSGQRAWLLLKHPAMLRTAPPHRVNDSASTVPHAMGKDLVLA